MSIRTDEAARRPARARRRLLLVAAALLVVVLVVLWLGRSDADTAGASAPATPTTSVATPTTAAPTATPPAPVATGEPVVADELPPGLPPVDLDEAAEVDDRIAVSLEALKAIQGTGIGPGNVAGPALRVTVRIANRSGDPVGLDAVAVNLTSGEKHVPAPPLNDPSAAPFTGTVAPGDTAEGVYVFTIAEGARDLVTVSVGYQPGAPFAVFTGSAD
jgi:hypothetical protein